MGQKKYTFYPKFLSLGPVAALRGHEPSPLLAHSLLWRVSPSSYQIHKGLCTPKMLRDPQPSQVLSRLPIVLQLPRESPAGLFTSSTLTPGLGAALPWFSPGESGGLAGQVQKGGSLQR